jgi:hypothetical protein
MTLDIDVDGLATALEHVPHTPVGHGLRAYLQTMSECKTPRAPVSWRVLRTGKPKYKHEYQAASGKSRGRGRDIDADLILRTVPHARAICVWRLLSIVTA